MRTGTSGRERIEPRVPLIAFLSFSFFPMLSLSAYARQERLQALLRMETVLRVCTGKYTEHTAAISSNSLLVHWLKISKESISCEGRGKRQGGERRWLRSNDGEEFSQL